MPGPRVFISSTYVDLADLREVLGEWLTSLSWQPTLFERGGIAYDPSSGVDEACCEAVSQSDMFVLIVGGRYGTSAPSGRYNSITRKEYLAAREAGIPTYVFVKHDVAVEFKTWLRADPTSRATAYLWEQVDHPRVFKLLEHIYTSRRGNIVFEYTTVSDIIADLKEQIAGITEEHFRRQRRKPAEPVPLNGCKLFFFRMQRGFSFTDLARATGIGRNRLRRLEKVRSMRTEPLGPRVFQKCDPSDIDTLERVLGCQGKLRAGADDDFLSLYIHYYKTYKGQAPGLRHRTAFELAPFPTRAVVFDFDGTLTVRDRDMTTWELIWVELGYDVNDCARYHDQFRKGEITHRQWCEITTEHFRCRGLGRESMAEIASRITLLEDAGEVLNELHDRGTELYILSGSIRQVIKAVLGDLCELFSEVQANDMTFDRDGIISNIFGTRYDFEGKADFIKQVIDRSELSPLEVLFVGNSSNDVFASRSGARTLCVNPHLTDPNVLEHWTDCLRDIKSLREILPYCQ